MHALAMLCAAVDALVDAEPSSLADGESLVQLGQQLERLTAVVTRATAAFDAAKSWEADGARSAAAWLATRAHLPMATARRRVRLGRQLRCLPAAESAWLAGQVAEAQVGLLARARTPATAEVLARDEGMLVEQASRLRFADFARLLAYWSRWADPSGAEDQAQAQRDARRLHLSRTFGGAWVLDGLFDPIGGTIVAEELHRIEGELFAADWGDARQRAGEAATARDLARTPAQRRADALTEMARRSAGAPAGARRPAPLFTVLVGYETFRGSVCELSDGTPVTPGSVRPWLTEAEVERVVFDGPSRVIDVGVRRRFFAGGTRRAVQVRDRQCFHEFCEAPADRCEIDHVEPWAAGGLTMQENGRPACEFHNRHRHRRRS